MYKRLIGCLILANIIFSVTTPSAISTDNDPWWDENWSFRQEIDIPINTTITHAHYQPIDIFIEFDKPCWAKNEKEHSVRVIFQENENLKEIESQIYDLNYSDDSHIDSCSLVFLIPEEANGNEKYYIYYDDDQKSAPIYPDRVSVDESYYRYEPIQGLSFESSFYKVTEGDYTIYGISKEGSIFGDPITQQVVKLKKNSTEVRPKNGEELASFHFTYWWFKNGKWDGISTAEHLVSNQIFVDGNLMVKIGIVSESNDGLLRSTVIYKYYYCPTEDKRIHTQVKHEVIDYPLPVGEEIDVGYVTLISGGVKSSNIEELNFGRILPYIHFYSDEERIRTYNTEQYPEGKNHPIISEEEDCDLGSFPWTSIDEGLTGKAHAIIFESNKVLQSGAEERDGIQLQFFEGKEINLPGVDGRLANLYITKDTYEKGEKPDDILTEDFVAEFNAEFFTTENEGYLAVEKEADIYQKIVSYHPTNIDDITDNSESENKYELTVYPRLSKAISLEMGLAASMLKNPYITVELYRNNSIFTSARASRFTLDPETVIDWENVSLFRRARFDDLPAGTYLIKIWFENPPFEDERQFIGWQLIDLQKDTETRIKCVPGGKIQVSIVDQCGKGLANTQVCIMKNDIIIAGGKSNITGDIPISLPCNLKDTYTLKVKYKGFLVGEQQIRVGLIRKILPLKIPVEIAVHDVIIHVQNDQGDAPSFNIGMRLTSDNMEYPTEIMPDESSPGAYTFNDLYPADYNLIINYQSFEIQEKIQIPKISSMTIVLYDFIVNVKDTWDLLPGVNLDVVMMSDEFVKPVMVVGKTLSAGVYQFSNLYPADYTLKLTYKTFVVKESIHISSYSSDKLEMSFPAEFNVTAAVLDTRGNPLKDAKVVMIRGEKEANRTTNESGNAIFSIPPGSYNCSIYYNDELIANRRVEVLTEKNCELVTTNEPLLPAVVTGLTIIFIIGIAFLSYRKKDAAFFLKILAILLVVLAIVSPWWALNGSSSDPYTETSTKLFLMPTKMVIITSNDNATAGELLPLDENLEKEVDLLFTTVVVGFVFVTDLLLIAIVIGSICIILSLILSKYSKKKLSFMLLILAFLIYILFIVVFSYAVSELINETVGDLVGSGSLGVSIPGGETYNELNCSWGPDIGFYLLLLSIGTLMLTILLNIKRRFKMRKI